MQGPSQQIDFCETSDGVRIAYSTIGSGPLLVKAPNWLSHLEFEWESPLWGHWWKALARDFTLVRFDQRGSGLSDWDVPRITFESWVADLEAVVEASAAGRFSLLGISQGGAVAVEYAARHPERVDKMVLCGAYTRGGQARGGSALEYQARLVLMREGWGRNNPAYRQIFTSQFMPGATLQQMNWFNELQRVSTSGENAARVQEIGSKVNVLDRLSQVRMPTLVLHARGDERVPFEEGRLLASLIPDARLVALDSSNHLTVSDEPAWEVLIDNVRRFLLTGQVVLENPAATGVTVALSPRELEVLRLIVAGKTNLQIADELVISLNTVQNHVSSILTKTGAANRTEAAGHAHRYHLV